MEILSDNILKGSEETGAKVDIKQIQYAKPEDVLKADAVVFGSPSMDNNQVDQTEMGNSNERIWI